MRLFLLLLLIPNLLSAQQTIQQEKYWIYRERMKNFVVSGNCTGCGIPSDSRVPGVVIALPGGGVLSYSDPAYALGPWIGTLAMEYDLLRRACQENSQLACDQLESTKKDLFYAIEALNQLDYEAESIWGCTPALNGFFLRDNIRSDFGTKVVDGKTVYDHLNDCWVPLPDGFRATCFKSGFTSYPAGKSETSQDHLTQIFLGLAITKKVFENLQNEQCSTCGPTQDGKFMDGETSFLKEVQNISDRIITHLKSHAWIYTNPCTNFCVLGTTVDHSQNPCVAGSGDHATECKGNDCCIEGGAMALPQAVGFAAVNKYIQAGTSKSAAANTLFISLIGDPVTYSAWVIAIANAPFIGVDDLPMTLATLGNFWHANSTTAKVAEKIKKRSIDGNWQHYILLHRYLYGDQLDNKENIITIPFGYYDCMLNDAPCRGFDGTLITGGNVEWGCLKRLIGHRGASQDCHDCDGKKTSPITDKKECNVDSGNDGMPGWSLIAFNRIDFMFYYNLNGLVHPVLPQSVIYPIAIKNLALEDIVKPDAYLSSYEEIDKKNFMAANSITANSYTINAKNSEQGRVTFVAGKHIDLLPGFEVKNGATLNAYIDPSIKAMTCVSPTDPSTDAAKVLQVTDCSSLSKRLFSETYEEGLVEQANSDLTSTIEIAPNPSTGKSTVTFTDNLLSKQVLLKHKMEIYNIFLECISTAEFIGEKHEIDLSFLPKGMYFVKVQAGGTTYTEKLILQ